MKDHGWSWTMFGAARVSLKSIDRILDVSNAKNMVNIAFFFLWAIWPPSLFKDSETAGWLELRINSQRGQHNSSYFRFWPKLNSTTQTRVGIVT